VNREIEEEGQGDNSRGKGIKGEIEVKERKILE